MPDISVGSGHSCALDAAGVVTCWGANNNGELGNGSPVQSDAFLAVLGLGSGVKSVVAGRELACAIKVDGAAFCWGRNLYGELGIGVHGTQESSPVAVLGHSSGTVAMAAGDFHVCSLDQAGQVRCWGHGSIWSNYETPRPIAGLPAPAVSIHADGTSSCALLQSGEAWCWEMSDLVPKLVDTGVSKIAQGAMFLGSHQCFGKPSGAMRCRHTGAPDWKDITGLEPVVSLAAGSTHACALTAAGEVKCWGYVSFPPGNGITPNPVYVPFDRWWTEQPTRIEGLPAGIVSVWAGWNSSCATTVSGELWCWGSGHLLGLQEPSAVPRKMNVPGQGAMSVGIGSGHTCAATSTGSAVCMGSNTYGELGTGRVLKSPVPLRVVGLPAAISISAGRDNSCAIANDGALYCWGGGVAPSGGNSSTPVAIPGWPAATSVSVGQSFACVLAADNVHCTDTFARAPLRIHGLASPVEVAAGTSSACALTNTGSVYCWGANVLEQPVPAAFLVTGLPGPATQVTLGDGHACALVVGGDVYCWGDGIALAGVADGGSATPVRIPGLPEPATQIDGGHRYTCAVMASTRVYCWGAEDFGKMGTERSSFDLAPVEVPDLAGVARVRAGLFMFWENVATHSCVLLQSGAVLCFGSNAFGGLGNGTFSGGPKPVAVVAQDGQGNLEGDNWYLRPVPGTPNAVPSRYVPRMLVVAQLTVGSAVTLDATVRYRASDVGKPVSHYVLALVPPSFFSAVKTAPGTPAAAQLKARAKDNLVLAQLTPNGWTTVNGQLIAHTRATANAAGNGGNILDRVPASVVTGARFCIGYGSGAQSMLAGELLRVVLDSGGRSASGMDCVLSGIYLAGPPTSRAGSDATFEAAVVGLSPTGQVQFFDGASLLGARTLEHPNEAVGTASFTTASLAVGLHSIGAAYFGDSQNATMAVSDSIPVRHEVQAIPAGTTTTLVAPLSARRGEAVVLSATVTGNSPTGSIQFKDGAAAIASAELDRGVATVRYVPATLGERSLTAVYPGDAQNASSTSNVRLVAVADLLATSARLSISPSPAVAGQPVTFTANVSGASPTGNVAFRAGARLLGAAALSGGVATATVASLESGLFLVTAEYDGDADDMGASSEPTYLEVSQPMNASVTVAQSSANPSTLAQLVTFTATVSGASGTPTGTVTILNGGVAIPGCAGLTLSLGRADCPTNATLNGATIVAQYAGSPVYLPSASAPLTQVVNAGASLLTIAPVDFGAQTVNTTSPPVAMAVRNDSAGTVAVSAVAVPAGFNIASNGCAGALLSPGASCQLGIVFSPVSARAHQGLLAVQHSGGGPSVAMLAGAGEASLVSHYYRAILGRPPDQAGKAFWESERARLVSLGASVNEVWFVMANYFFNSAEYQALNKTNTAFLADVYNTFFNRPPDQGGFDFWTSQLGAGLSREGLTFWFMFSNEFRTFNEAIFGATAARPEVDMVMDLFRGILNRFPETAALNAYVGSLRQAQCAPSAQRAGAVYKAVNDLSYFFLFGSAEYANRGRTHRQFVSDMYNAFLRRGGTAGELQGWIAQLDAGTRDRNQLRAAFIDTPEFGARVNAVIAAGCLP